MNHATTPAPLHPLIGIAICSGITSVCIAALAFCLLRINSDSGLWAIAAMTSAPSLMGVAMAFFITKHPRPDTSTIE
jgi:hypothetical protein